jgi:hypothetical protein
MSLYDQYATDASKEAEGVEVTFPPNNDGTMPTFILAATSKNNQKYAKALETATKPYRRNMDALKNETAEALYRDVFVKTVLKGWTNIQDKAGNDIPYSREAALKLFEDLPRLYEDLNARAGSIDLFREAQQEDEAGN